MKYIFVLALLTLAAADSGTIDCSACRATDFMSAEEALNKALQMYEEKIRIKYKAVKINSASVSQHRVLKYKINADLAYNDTSIVKRIVEVKFRDENQGKYDKPSWMNLNGVNDNEKLLVECPECVNDTDFETGEQVLKKVLQIYHDRFGLNFEFVKINSMSSSKDIVKIYLINADLSDTNAIVCTHRFRIKADNRDPNDPKLSIMAWDRYCNLK